ncbi:MAG: M24 family metallopeptidase, partial [Pseudomonadota bacterium]
NILIHINQSIQHHEIEHHEIEHNDNKNITTYYTNPNYNLHKHNIIYYTNQDSTLNKIQYLRNKMQKNNAQAYVINNIEEASWLLNIRGRYNKNNMSCPVHIIIKHNTLDIYTDITLNLDKLSYTTNSKDTLPTTIKIKPMQEFYSDIKLINYAILLSPSNFFTYKTLKEHIVSYNTTKSIIALIKRVKNNNEIDQIKKIHIQDAVILIQFYAWIHDQHIHKKQLYEMDLAKHLLSLREKNKSYICNSFEPIIAINAGSAIPHYNTQKNNTKLENGILLIDTGGHYEGGTTDVTRSFFLNNNGEKPTQQMKYIYTTVLKAHLSIYKTIMPQSCPMSNIGAIIRNQILSQEFTTNKTLYYSQSDIINYGHGTGHGIGNCLNVHEHVCNRLEDQSSLANNLLFSNEPGLYLPEQFGIRIENAMLSQPYTTNTNYITFENLTFIPFSKALIDKNLINETEKNIILQYYKQINEKITPLIKCNNTLTWLKNELNIEL